MVAMHNSLLLICLFLIPRAINNVPIDGDNFNLTIIHINDFHARFEETDELGDECLKKPCIGGYSRLYKTITRLLEDNPNALLLCAGDNFQGTLWYSIFKWNVTQHFMNKIPFDAFTLGNHEFDDGVEGVVEYMKRLKAPVVVSNMDASHEATIKPLFEKSTVVERSGKKIGIIGAIVRNVDEKSKTGNLTFSDESKSVNAEAERLLKEEDVFTNIVLSHSGYYVELEMAQKATNKIGVIVGGHSHSFLYSGDRSPGADKILGTYPTIVERKDKKKVLVTQASSFCRYIGIIHIGYDKHGDVLNWSGEPIYLDTDILQDDAINNELALWKEEINVKGKQIIGKSLVVLDGDSCQDNECSFGNIVADAMIFDQTANVNSGSWTNAAIAIMNGGGIRMTIPAGDITDHQLLPALPFEDTINVGDIQGKHLREIFEFASLKYERKHPLNILQVSGVHVIYDLSLPDGQKMVSIKVRCAECEIPTYSEIDDDRVYKLSIVSFFLNGGDGFRLIKDNMKNLVMGGKVSNAIRNYLRTRSPVFVEVAGRTEIRGLPENGKGYQQNVNV